MSRKITAVIFDQDGLMFDTERLALEGWEMVAGAYGVCPGKDFFRDLRGTKTDKVREALIRQYGAGIDYEAMFREKRMYSYRWIQEHGVPVKSGLRELLSYLRGQGIAAAVATASSREWTQGNVKGAGLDRYFDAYIYGDMVAEAKPDPAIFLLAASMLGRKPGECMVLEDSFNGIRAAASGGFLPVMVPDQDEPDEELTRLLAARCDTLSEVQKLFEDGIF